MRSECEDRETQDIDTRTRKRDIMCFGGVCPLLEYNILNMKDWVGYPVEKIIPNSSIIPNFFRI